MDKWSRLFARGRMLRGVAAWAGASFFVFDLLHGGDVSLAVLTAIVATVIVGAASATFGSPVIFFGRLCQAPRPAYDVILTVVSAFLALLALPVGMSAWLSFWVAAWIGVVVVGSYWVLAGCLRPKHAVVP